MTAPTAASLAPALDRQAARAASLAPRSPAYVLSALLAAVTLVASAASFFVPGMFDRDAVALAGCARGTALVILLVDVPLLLLAMWLAARGSVRARVAWLGVLGAIAYNSGYFTFAATMNRLFFVYVAMLSLSVWSLGALVAEMKPASFVGAFSVKMPVRLIAAFAILPLAEYFLLDVAKNLPAVIDGSIPANLVGTQMPTNTFGVMDLAFSVPLFVASAVWLVRRQPWGFVATGALWTYFAIELVSVAADQYFGTLADPNSPELAAVSIIPVLGVFLLISLVPITAFYRHVERPA